MPKEKKIRPEDYRDLQEEVAILSSERRSLEREKRAMIRSLPVKDRIKLEIDKQTF